ncbi:MULTISPECIES: hypothetical protein [Streptomycetaceae]|uniref:Uncharacterized protein n=1 Tax=Streptantibioticus cattleyicolor (strain ATCC 35852 / DSM 46488 / JCM 4925 / NBRC 14057 / NRRL 8057) TaxID=1003195 RepID=F8JY56_STREN|nr:MULTISPECIES: hypothetical protein [Streptomycetaceae]AEW94632.1 hypothetical protein SCATT_22610 [Streptantibioticus cattleyicolor NRRL 8057 = DSM 46488]MYS59270.1 hypothetical protein [Streptomyces sp. SID5468]CCB74989.1 protein of unknown function [Streptantibioticus cattleyicolor NRRL 8057 = DSM 46488]
MTGRRSSSGARRTRCPRCGRPVITQLVGRRAALAVVADDEPMPTARAAGRTTPDRLAWCLRDGPFAGIDLRWVYRSHPPDCPHPHVLDHQCTAPLRPPAGPRSSHKHLAGPPGQIALDV